MAGETYVTIVGNITADPELRFVANGSAVANFTVASNSRYFNRNSGQWEEKATMFIRCEAWRSQADNIAETLKKGMRVMVHGELSISTYSKQDGSTGTSVDIKNAEVAVSLKYAKAQVERVSTGQNQGYGQGGSNTFGDGNTYGQGNSASGDWGQSSQSSFDSDTPPPF